MSFIEWVNAAMGSTTQPKSAPAERDYFPDSLTFILAREGGFVNNAADPGGATNRGITLATARAVFGADYSVAELRAITPTQAGAIYRPRYWDAASCGSLPGGVALTVFDASVMSGPETAKKMLQTAAGVTADGAVGPRTISACAVNPKALVDALAAARVAFYRGIVAGRPASSVFLPGWLNRVELTRRKAQDMTLSA
jgi:lysozyme family protein